MENRLRPRINAGKTFRYGAFPSGDHRFEKNSTGIIHVDDRLAGLWKNP
ncbi:MAG: hypothetical protein ACE5FS_14255 [Paracoccaceae bacterium]